MCSFYIAIISRIKMFSFYRYSGEFQSLQLSLAIEILIRQYFDFPIKTVKIVIEIVLEVFFQKWQQFQDNQ